jgi:hypothetical protein
MLNAFGRMIVCHQTLKYELEYAENTFLATEKLLGG